jgi:hypothetical protein
MGAAYAYLTSYGRWLMAGIRSIVSRENVIAQDTDGIWTFDTAKQLLYPDGNVHRSNGGDICWKTLSPVGRFYGPQHYWYGAGWVISGSNVVTHRPKTDTIVVKDRKKVTVHSRNKPDPIIVENIYERTIGRMHVAGEIDTHGYVLPIKLYQSE